MLKKDEQLNILDTMLTEGVKAGLLHLTPNDDYLDGRIIHINNKPVINFGSCSYLGLETDPRLKQGGIDAINHFGTQFSSSRTYVSAPPYTELENLLSNIFEAPIIVAPTTSLAHLSTLPVIIGAEDAVIFDQMVHASVQTAVKILQAQGNTIEILHHNKMNLLEEKIEKLRKNHKKVWYLADGVYSMFGELAPVNDLEKLLNKYEQFHVYLDDAHGMSWIGKHGRGKVLSQVPLHERMIVVQSMAKAFAAGGGIVIFPNKELARKVKTCGGPMIFSGPIQPATLGAAIASAKIHLSDEIITLQKALQERQQYCNQLLSEYGLPLVSFSDAPIRYIGMGLPRVTFNMSNRLLADGFYTNIAIFPAVPMKKAGIRFTITLHQSLEDIKNLVQAMARHLPKVLEEENTSIEDIERGFKIKIPNKKTSVSASSKTENRPITIQSASPELILQHETTIKAISKEEWDKLLGENGSFTWEGLSFLENTFQNNPEPENNWNFHYYIIRDKDNTPILTTFFTDALWKDDMLASKEVSKVIEHKRKDNPHFLVSRAFSMGSQLTEGEHLYLNKAKNWKEALSMLLKAISNEQEKCGATALILRDFPANDPEMDNFFLSHGFTKQAMPDSMVVEINWETQEEFIKNLSPKSRYYQRKEVLPWLDIFDIEVMKKDGSLPSEQELEHFYHLYQNVKKQNLELNTFDLPKHIFKNMLNSPSWELIVLKLKNKDNSKNENIPISIGACFKNTRNYCPIVIGLDYNYVISHHLYRASLYNTIMRAQQIKAQQIFLGMGASLEKKRFGAKARSQCAYVQLADHYNFELMENIKNNEMTNI